MGSRTNIEADRKPAGKDLARIGGAIVHPRRDRDRADAVRQAMCVPRETGARRLAPERIHSFNIDPKLSGNIARRGAKDSRVPREIAKRQPSFPHLRPASGLLMPAMKKQQRFSFASAEPRRDMKSSTHTKSQRCSRRIMIANVGRRPLPIKRQPA